MGIYKIDADITSLGEEAAKILFSSLSIDQLLYSIIPLEDVEKEAPEKWGVPEEAFETGFGILLNVVLLRTSTKDNIPQPVLNALEKRGYYVNAYFYSADDMVCGQYHDGILLKKKITKYTDIPKEIVDKFKIAEF